MTRPGWPAGRFAVADRHEQTMLMNDAPGLKMDDRETTDGSPQRDGRPARAKDENEMGFALPSAIGDRLKAYYNDVASEPVPDRFVSLLERLDRAERTGAPKKDRVDE